MPYDASLHILQVVMIALFFVILGAILLSDLVPEVREVRARRAGAAAGIAALASLRLPRMLARHGLTPERFQQRLTPKQMDRAVDACRGCAGAARCDALLAGAAAPADGPSGQKRYPSCRP